MIPDNTKELMPALRAYLKKPKKLNGFVGFDGFIDEIISIVKSRTDIDQYTPFTSMGSFADKVQKAAGK